MDFFSSVLRKNVAFLISIVLLTAFGLAPIPTHASSGNAASPIAYVPTPAGLVASICVHGIGNDATILKNGAVRFANGTMVSYPPCNSEPLFPCSNYCWVTWAWYEKSSGISNFDGNWPVPGAPTSNDGQVIFLWIGTECCNAGASGSSSANILQPVLQWGRAADGGGNYYVIASWYIDQNGNAYYSSPVAVSGGAGLSGGIDWVFNPNLNEYGWQASLSAGSQHSNLYVGALNGQYNTMTDAYVNLEAYYVTKCSDYPSGGATTFSSLYMGTITPNWSSEYNVPNMSGCGEGVTVNSASSVTIAY